MTGLNSVLVVVLTAVVIATVVSQSTIDEFDNEPSSQERIAKREHEQQKEQIAKLEHKVAFILDRLNHQEEFTYCLDACRLGKSPFTSNRVHWVISLFGLVFRSAFR